MELEDAKALVRLAREAISTYFSRKHIDMDSYKGYGEKQGVFVTLSLYGKLRGCIGFPEPVYPLNRAVVEAARAAAFKDSRFAPLTPLEFEDVTIEVSVLSVPLLIEVDEPADYMARFIIGKHGLVIKKDYHYGLLLPQVFLEYGCTPKEALEMVCEKAGLHQDDWKEEGIEIYSFSAEIFEEDEDGSIIKK
ncbi:MAG: TIGR00296 family protein [Candidatus Woesearchaeota archaeon]|nr:TIGR00296 family protein [Candidatus Woesearchaeota archaeon]